MSYYKKQLEKINNESEVKHVLIKDFDGNETNNLNLNSQSIPILIEFLQNELKRQNKFCSYRINTFDVWGNNKDGFEVNDSYNSGEIGFSLSTDDKEIYQRIKNLLGLKPRFSSLDFQWNNNSCFVVLNTKKFHGYPLFSLTKIED